VAEILGRDMTVSIVVVPAVQVNGGLVFEYFRQDLVIRSRGPVLEIERAGLQQTQSSNLGEFGLRQEGRLTYSVVMKAGSPVGAAVLQPPVTASPSVTPPVGPGAIIFSKLVDRMDASFVYDFVADKAVKDLQEDVTVVAVLENPEVWQKAFVLVPPTRKSGGFRIDFPFDVPGINQALENIRNETGVSGQSYKLTIRADVRVTAQTDHGPIDETFSPALTTSLEKGVIQWEEELGQSKPGSIETTSVVANTGRYLGMALGTARILSLVFLAVAVVGFAFCLWTFLRAMPKELSDTEKECLRIGNKYRSRILEAAAHTPGFGDRTVSAASIDDLVKMADELGKPVIHQLSGTSKTRHTYYVFDSSITYQYTIGDDQSY
jgi:hypothetical protein